MKRARIFYGGIFRSTIIKPGRKFYSCLLIGRPVRVVRISKNEKIFDPGPGTDRSAVECYTRSIKTNGATKAAEALLAEFAAGVSS